MNKIGGLVLALLAALGSGSTAAQILQNIEDKIVGKTSPDQVAAARDEVRARALVGAALLSLLVYLKLARVLLPAAAPAKSPGGASSHEAA